MDDIFKYNAITAEFIFNGKDLLKEKAVLVEDGVIIDIVDKNTIHKDLLVDYGKGVISAGFVDLQLNGCGGALFNDDISLKTLEIMYQTCLKYGTTAFLPTLITCDFTDVLKALMVVKDWFSLHGNRRGVLGVHLEGPFISKDKKGIHLEEYIIKPNDELLTQIVEYCKFFPIKMTIAVEKFSNEQIQYLADNGVILSIGHSNASYSQVASSLSYVTTSTHLFNAMSGLTGRNPGVIGAILNNECYAGVIADLIHVDAANINFLHKIKKGKMYLITDGVTPVGTDMTEFILAGKKLFVKDGKCVNELGVLGGANLTMLKAVFNCVHSCGIKLVDALQMATIIPLEVMKIRNTGRIEKGYYANLIHLDLENIVCKVIF